MGQSNGSSRGQGLSASLVPTLRLLLARSRRTWGFRVALGLGVLSVFAGLLFLTIVRGTRTVATDGALSALPSLFAHAICWGVSTLAVFGTEQRAYLKDHEDGIRSLLGLRGLDRHYGLARIVTSITNTAILSVGCTAILSIATALAATGTGEAARTWVAAFRAIVYSASFSVLLGTLGLAVLGGRGRGGGYLGLLTILVLPELIEPLTKRALPFDEALPVSLPSILSAIAKPSSAGQFVAAVAIGGVVVGLGYAYAKRERQRVDRELHEATRLG